MTGTQEQILTTQVGIDLLTVTQIHTEVAHSVESLTDQALFRLFAGTDHGDAASVAAGRKALAAANRAAGKVAQIATLADNLRRPLVKSAPLTPAVVAGVGGERSRACELRDEIDAIVERAEEKLFNAAVAATDTVAAAV